MMVSSDPVIRISPSDRQRRDQGERKWWHSNPFAKKSLRQTLMDMTLHGVPKTADLDRVVWSRLVWLLGVLTCTVVFLAMFYWLVEDYYNYPFQTKMKFIPADRLPFPAISICNINTLDVTLVPYADTLREVMSWSMFGLFRIPLDVVAEDYSHVLNKSAQAILRETEPDLSNMFLACFYDNDYLPCDQLFNVSYWAMTRCYTLDVSRLSLASATTILRLIVNINQLGYVPQQDSSVGVKFHIHPVDSVPNFDLHTRTAAPGFSTFVAMNYEEMRMLGYPYKTYGDRYCVKSENVDTTGLPIKGQYRLITCLKFKALQQAQSTCSCKPPFESESELPDCTLYEMKTCVLPVLDNLSRKNQNNASIILGCPLPCELQEYHAAVTFSYFPSPQSEKLLKTQNKILNETNLRENILDLNFFYGDMKLFEIEYVPEYNSMTIMGSIGGNMGLFLGVSVISLAELVEVILIGLFRLLFRLFGVTKGPQGESKTP